MRLEEKAITIESYYSNTIPFAVIAKYTSDWSPIKGRKSGQRESL